MAAGSGALARRGARCAALYFFTGVPSLLLWLEASENRQWRRDLERSLAEVHAALCCQCFFSAGSFPACPGCYRLQVTGGDARFRSQLLGLRRTPIPTPCLLHTSGHSSVCLLAPAQRQGHNY